MQWNRAFTILQKSSFLKKNALTDKINDREMFMKGIDYSYYYEEGGDDE